MAVRKVTALLCFSLIFPIAGADPAPPSPTDTYISVRDRYIADLKARTDPTGKRADRAVADLETRLKAIIPPWRASGFPPEGKINLNGIDDNQIGLSVLNGLAYTSGDTEVVVTTPALLRRWASDHNQWWDRSDDIPLSLDAALRSDAFWTYAMFDDAHAALYGEVTVTPRKGAAQTVVLLSAFAQDLVFDAGPSDILVAMVYPDRVFVARQKMAVTTQAVPACEASLKEMRAKSEAAQKVYRASKDPVQFNASVKLDERADREYRACFATHFREQPHHREIIRQAQSLVDLLH